MKQRPLLPRSNGTWTRHISPTGEVSTPIIIHNGPYKGATYELIKASPLHRRPGWLVAEYRVVGFNPIKRGGK